MLDEHGSILSSLDEPLADASYIPTYMLCRLARRHVTVALSGDGGDELFAGYPTFAAEELAVKIERLPEWIIHAMRLCADRLPTSMNNLSFDFRLKQFLKGMSYKGLVRSQVWLGAFSDRDSEKLLAPSLQKQASRAYSTLSQLTPGGNTHWMQALQAFYFQFYLQGDILVKVDRASMANSLEVRSPFLDDRLVQSMLGMPASLKMKSGVPKYFLKKAMVGRLPSNIIYRGKKGFGIPIAKWIRQDLRNEFEATLSGAELKKDGLFSPAEVRRLLDEHHSGKTDNRKKLWTLYVFQKWKRQWKV